MKCRHCYTPLEHVFLDLGFAPPSNAFLTAEDLERPERHYPLKLFVCHECWLVQTQDYAEASDLFGHDYPYFSSISQSWLEHARRYASSITTRLGLSDASFVLEIGANDGYLLRYFLGAGIPCLGIEPTASTASAAEKLGIPIVREFFSQALATRLASTGPRADLIVANNVYAHVPNLNDFTAGLKTMLNLGGTITLEFTHLLRLIERTLFDTAYHEHFSYYSLHAVKRVLEDAGLRVWDVEQLVTQGGSLRVYACHASDPRSETAAVAEMLSEEVRQGVRQLDVYRAFQARADRAKDDLVMFLIEQKRRGKAVAGYGAAAKGNTLLNYAGIKPDLLPYVCDAASFKQGKFLPGSHIPILPPDVLKERRPDILLILAWNIAEEVVEQESVIREWGGQFAVAMPTLSLKAD